MPPGSSRRSGPPEITPRRERRCRSAHPKVPRVSGPRAGPPARSLRAAEESNPAARFWRPSRSQIAAQVVGASCRLDDPLAFADGRDSNPRFPLRGAPGNRTPISRLPAYGPPVERAPRGAGGSRTLVCALRTHRLPAGRRPRKWRAEELNPSRSVCKTNLRPGGLPVVIVRVTGIEPAASRSQSARSTKMS